MVRLEGARRLLLQRKPIAVCTRGRTKECSLFSSLSSPLSPPRSFVSLALSPASDTSPAPLSPGRPLQPPKKAGSKKKDKKKAAEPAPDDGLNVGDLSREEVRLPSPCPAASSSAV